MLLYVRTSHNAPLLTNFHMTKCATIFSFLYSCRKRLVLFSTIIIIIVIIFSFVYLLYLLDEDMNGELLKASCVSF